MFPGLKSCEAQYIPSTETWRIDFELNDIPHRIYFELKGVITHNYYHFELHNKICKIIEKLIHIHNDPSEIGTIDWIIKYNVFDISTNKYIKTYINVVD